MKKLLCGMLALLLILSLSGCMTAADPSDRLPDPPETSESSSESPESSDTSPAEPSPVSTPAATPVPDKDNLGKKILVRPASVNPLTGGDAAGCDPAARPVAVMINNIKKALPQHGLKDADIIYEIPAEGGITRLLAVFQDISKAGVIGSVRSSRAIFIDVARSYDAIYVHHGGSPEAYTMIKAGLVASIDGMNSGDTFYRDEWRRKNMGYEHSSMTTGAKLASRIKAKNFRTRKKDSYTAFHFVYTDLVPAGASADKVSVKTGSYTSEYTYNRDSGTYIRRENGYDYDNNGTGKLDFRNIFVLEMKYSVVAGDEKGRLSFKNIGSGSGYYITGGGKADITWKWSDEDQLMRYYDKSGNELEVNAGKSFIHFVSSLKNTSMS